MVWFQRKAAKFYNKKTVYNGRKYDSKGEAGLAVELEMMKKAGKIREIQPQVTYPLYGQNGTKVCTHRVDFLVVMKDYTQQVVEYKGFETAEWKIKCKLFVDNYPKIEYWVVSTNGWSRV